MSHAPGIIAPSARLEIRGGREEWLRDLPQICFINPAYLAIFMHAITSGRAKTPVQFKMNYLMHLP